MCVCERERERENKTQMKLEFGRKTIDWPRKRNDFKGRSRILLYAWFGSSVLFWVVLVVCYTRSPTSNDSHARLMKTRSDAHGVVVGLRPNNNNNNNNKKGETSSSSIRFVHVPPKYCGMTFTDFFGSQRIMPTLHKKKGSKHNPTFLWTVSGGPEYRKELPTLLSRWKTLGLHPLTVVALDDETAQEVCRLGYSAILWDPPQSTYSRVADAKFGMTATLAEHTVKGWFLELDVFCRESPVSLVEQELYLSTNNNKNNNQKPAVDLWHLGHGDMNFYPNIGMYYAQPTPQVAQFFRSLLKVLSYSKDHRSYITQTGNSKKFFDQDVYYHCLPSTKDSEYNERHGRKYYIENADGSKINVLDHCLADPPSLTYQAFSHVDINSHNPPTILDNTRCIHPLSSQAFSSLGLKIANAKYLGFDPTPLPPRILKDYGGDLTANECWYATFYREGVFANPENRERFQYHLASLVVLAMETKRVLVVPRHFRDKDGWALSVPSVVDVRSIEKLVPYRFMLVDEARSLADQQEVVKVVAPTTADDGAAVAMESTREALRAVDKAPVVSIKQSCALIPPTPKSPFDRKVMEVIAKLSWCMDADTNLKFKRAIGGYDRFCGVS